MPKRLQSPLAILLFMAFVVDGVEGGHIRGATVTSRWTVHLETPTYASRCHSSWAILTRTFVHQRHGNNWGTELQPGCTYDSIYSIFARRRIFLYFRTARISWRFWFVRVICVRIQFWTIFVVSQYYVCIATDYWGYYVRFYYFPSMDHAIFREGRYV